MNIDWKRKLTSRKLWLAIAGLVAGLILAFKGDAEVAETVSGVIMSVASVIAYIFGEGLVDATKGDETKWSDGFETGYDEGWDAAEEEYSDYDE